jgi:predicted ATPase
MTTPSANTPFIGRAKEFHMLRDALPNADRKSGGFVAITGEPGIGKTRLMEEIAELAVIEGRRVLWSQMLEDPGAPPYLSWTLVLRDYAQQCDDDTLRRHRIRRRGHRGRSPGNTRSARRRRANRER